MRTNRHASADETHDAVSIALHWTTVLLILCLFLLSLFPGIVKGSIALHKTLGLLVLIIVPLRIAWRLFGARRPQTMQAEPLLLRLGATGAHLALYALLLVTPMLGWLYVDAKGMELALLGFELPSVTYYDRELAMSVYWLKQWAAYGLLALILAHAAAAIGYHSWIRRDGVLRSMVPRRFRRGRIALTVALLALLPADARSEAPFDVEKYAAELAASLSKACPMAAPGDIAAHEECRRNIGQGVEAGMRGYSFLFGGQQQGLWLKEKKTSVFRGDLFQDLYMSLYMYTGKFAVSAAPDGLKVIALQAYFRNELPPGRYPYPFWHSDRKWEAYEKSNQLRFRVAKDGRVMFAYRADIGSDENRGPYRRVERPPFLGEWMWPDDRGAAQPVATLFSEYYSRDNPHLTALDAAYRRMAMNFRDADCTVCHAPDGHRKMNKLTLLQTPMHAAASIDAVLDEVRMNKMPVDDYNDPRPLPPSLRQALLANGDAFRQQLATADAWERANGRPKARKAPPN